VVARYKNYLLEKNTKMKLIFLGWEGDFKKVTTPWQGVAIWIPGRRYMDIGLPPSLGSGGEP